MPKCHKIYPNCIWQVLSEWHTLGFYSALSTKVYWNYATHIVRVCVTPISPQTSKLDPNDKSNIKSISALKQWLACTIFFPTIPLLVRTHSSRNYSPISLHAFTLIFSITLSMSTPRMRSQSIRSTLQLLHFILTTQLTFLKYFISYFCIFFMQLQDFYHKDGRTRHIKGPPAENSRRPARRARGPI